MEAFNDYTERFLNVVEALGLKDSEVVSSLEDLSKGTMSKIRCGRCGVSMNTLQSFCKAYPKVNSNYIITGKGNMFLDEEPVIEEADENQSKKGKIKIKIADMPKNASSPMLVTLSGIVMLVTRLSLK